MGLYIKKEDSLLQRKRYKVWAPKRSQLCIVQGIRRARLQWQGNQRADQEELVQQLFGLHLPSLRL
jgi:hypothetical protein